MIQPDWTVHERNAAVSSCEAILRISDSGQQAEDATLVLTVLGLLPDQDISPIELALRSGKTQEWIMEHFGVGSAIMTRMVEKWKARQITPEEE